MARNLKKHICLDKMIPMQLVSLMLGPYTTSVTPYCYQYNAIIILLYPCSPHIVIIVPHRSQLLLLMFHYIIIVMSTSIILLPLRLLYIKRRSYHLYHLRIVHLRNVKEVSLSKRLNSKVLIYLFYLFVNWFHNIWYQSFGFQGFSATNRSSWYFHYNIFYATFHKLHKKAISDEMRRKNNLAPPLGILHKRA